MTEVGVKGDQGKAPIFRGMLVQFPRAMERIASISAFGAAKYSWENWRRVDNASERYADAMVRHSVSEAKGEVLDPESGFHHAGHAAWNALAHLELILTDEQSKQNAS